ncbi:MAG TPA: glycoside hydrolase family 3 N-terminal domain-containing protein [Streptosporangiaceae bacterium]|nr:glycoside hydrolase family 3 N-terminal domain-containing protein [Streptosporangiaceae bacterium]
MSLPADADPQLGRLADAVLIPPFLTWAVPPWMAGALGRGLAGTTLYGLNIESPEQLAMLTAKLRAAAPEPVIAIDEEGGDVTRIAHRRGSPYPGNAALGTIDDPGLTEAVYAALGADLAGLGISLDLAPAVDVNTAADNPVIGTRAFGSDTALVARHAAAAVTGLQSAGVAACAKHFPGHGSTRIDSHHELPTVDAGMDLLAERDLPPFAAAIEAGVRAIMPGHLRVPELTGDLPASLSPAALTGLLRGELGFAGVIVSDGLEMRAVADVYGIPEAAVRAVSAGTDLLCLGRDQDERMYLRVRQALISAVRSGRMPGERLEDAAARVTGLRDWTAAAAGCERGGGAEIGLAAARRAVRVDGVPQPLHRPLVVEVVPPANMAAGPIPWGLGAFVPADSLRRIATGTLSEGMAGTISGLLAEAAGRSLVLVVRDAHRHPAAAGIATAILAARPDAVVVEMGLPVWRPPAGLYLATFGAARTSGRAAAEVLGLAGPC